MPQWQCIHHVTSAFVFFNLSHRTVVHGSYVKRLLRDIYILFLYFGNSIFASFMITLVLFVTYSGITLTVLVRNGHCSCTKSFHLSWWVNRTVWQCMYMIILSNVFYIKLKLYMIINHKCCASWHISIKVSQGGRHGGETGI